jgi:Domain of unknown function (DUF1996)
MRRFASLAFLVTIVGLTTPTASSESVEGVFSVLCDFSHQLWDDPIVYPGQAGAAHLHQFTGNVTTNASSTYASMIGQDTSCPLSADTAGYWVPALVTPTGTPVRAVNMNVYYRNQPNDGQRVNPFPPDFRMIAGHPKTPTGGGLVGWGCTDKRPYLAQPPNCGPVGKHLKAHVVFPNCWNGAVDSPDHRSHVVYPKREACPASHPLKLPRLSFHVTWAVRNPKGHYLSSDPIAGTPAGRSLHADFWNTWDQVELVRLTETCLNAMAACKNLRDPPPPPPPSPEPTDSPPSPEPTGTTPPGP